MVRFPRRLHRGQSQRADLPKPLRRDRTSLDAIGPLERGLGEVSIYDGVPLISEVHHGQTKERRLQPPRRFPGVRHRRELAPRTLATDRRRATARRNCALAVRAASTSISPFRSCPLPLRPGNFHSEQPERGETAELHEKAKFVFRCRPVGNHRLLFTPAPRRSRRATPFPLCRTLDNTFQAIWKIQF